MRKMNLPDFRRAMRRTWPALMDPDDISEFSGWTTLTIRKWIAEGQLEGAQTIDGRNGTHIPRELVFAQLDPENRS